MTSSAEWVPYASSVHTDEELLRASIERRHDYRFQTLSSLPATTDVVPLHSFTLDDISLCSALGDRASSLCQLSSSGRSSLVTPEQLASRWRCSVEVAKRTLQSTTQRAVHDYTNIIGGRRIRPTQYQLRYPRLNRQLYCDVWHGPCTSLEGNNFAVVFSASCQWSKVFPVKQRKDAHLSLDVLFRTVGFPEAIVPDYALELTKGQFLKKAQQAQVLIHPVEPYMHNLRPAEDCIRELVRLYSRAMVAMNIPAVLWDRCMLWVSEVRSNMNLGHLEQNGQVGTTCMTGNTADISHLANFTFYDWVWYHTPSDTGMKTRMQLGKWCGPSFDVGDSLCYAVINSKGSILHKTSVFPLKPEEVRSEEILRMKTEWNDELKLKLGRRIKGLSDFDADPGDKYLRPRWDGEIPEYQRYEDDTQPLIETPIDVALLESDDPIESDRWTSARIRTLRGDIPIIGTVKGRKRDEDGKQIGHWNTNPLLDTSEYEVEFSDGSVETYQANRIAEEIYQSVDKDGYLVDEISEIVDHKKDASAMRTDDSFVEYKGRKMMKRTTRGWKLLVEWKSGDTSWETLADLKEAYPVKVAEYARDRKLVHEAVFQWWVPHALRKKDRILQKLQKRTVRRKVEKFGIEVPRPMDVKRAMELDRETGTPYWRDAMKKEVNTVLPALHLLDEHEDPPVGSQEVDLMMIFDVKMDLTRKARLVARGDQVETPSNLTYASVVSRDSIRIGLLLASLNELSVLSADVAGAYLNAPCRERVFTTLGPAFGALEGRRAVIVKSLYGLNSGGFSWRSHCADTLRNHLGWKSCRADPDVWLRPAVKCNGALYYEYLLIHTDDLLCVSENPRAALDEINSYFLLKPESIGEPSTYLGGQITKFYIEGEQKWAYGSEKYVKEALRVIKKKLSEYGMHLKPKTNTVLPSGYRPELDSTPELAEGESTFYMQAVGILRWIVELGRVDICCEVSMMAAYNACPREGHIEAVMHIFSYLSCHERSRLVFDDAYPKHEIPAKADWREFYPSATDVLPPDMPEARGKPVQLTMFVDASHAANLVTRQSRSGVLIYCNLSLILWYSKRQNSIETSSFGSEFMALKTGFEMLEGLRYKLRMLGVSIDGPAMVMVDNMSVVKNTSIPESQLRKKSNSIAYHYVRERCAADIARICYIGTNDNLADMLTKVQPGPKRAGLAQKILR